jgi:hypothetical protein
VDGKPDAVCVVIDVCEECLGALTKALDELSKDGTEYMQVNVKANMATVQEKLSTKKALKQIQMQVP